MLVTAIYSFVVLQLTQKLGKKVILLITCTSALLFLTSYTQKSLSFFLAFILAI
jgi:hypothetical protein